MNIYKKYAALGVAIAALGITSVALAQTADPRELGNPSGFNPQNAVPANFGNSPVSGSSSAEATSPAPSIPVTPAPAPPTTPATSSSSGAGSGATPAPTTTPATSTAPVLPTHAVPATRLNASTVYPAPMEVAITGNGHALVRGVVQSVGTSTITIMSWGGEWDIITTNADLIADSGVSVGDFVGAVGSATSKPWAITATLVRDWTTNPIR